MEGLASSSNDHDVDSMDRIKKKQKVILLNQLGLQLATVNSLQAKIAAQRRALRIEEAFWKAQLQTLENDQWLQHIGLPPTPLHNVQSPLTIPTLPAETQHEGTTPFHFVDLDMQHFFEPIDGAVTRTTNSVANDEVGTSNSAAISTACNLWGDAETDVGDIFSLDST
ncbi:hypothetical protein BASA50_002642 [Batrachochytrium salamandrivorans]|uniref:BZIP domain-containing protein n=1 Tax=Batrachochytrium salamandrivorans TaxID=1357716 RepID=A0ABQ8F5Q8_9FUNG|nr:hypothetical protein BASA60_002283 [Batrachochytrium salamandrivorans]KAH6592731.1 hypothetical protein BASA50_007910 [Batrachochytrium salamandrivorans]KAH6600053.1 hypothetical protein BASA50_002642 [Batrachochytrium salamandrivorans]KAH6602333.1 hypothetical protein BASA61_001207 [Batrachochytrium salamandrivorans]KAH9271212.1 hypothetical protein BASA83_006531 [Batrachochytrium salamandrivorans]